MFDMIKMFGKINEIKAEAEKAKADKKTAIQKMKSTDRFSDEEIIEFLSLDKETFKEYLKEIEATK